MALSDGLRVSLYVRKFTSARRFHSLFRRSCKFKVRLQDSLLPLHVTCTDAKQGRLRELPSMMSALEGGEGHGKADVIREV